MPRGSALRLRTRLYAYLEPEDILAEIIFSLLMVMAVTGAVHLSTLDSADDCRLLLWAALGCNVAWGLADAVIFILTSVLERRRRVRFVRLIQSASTPEDAERVLAHRVNVFLGTSLPLELSAELRRELLALIRRVTPQPGGVRRDDLVGAFLTFSLVLLTTLPVVLPFLATGSPRLALRLSHLVAVILLFLTGILWARHADVKPIKAGIASVITGLLLTLLIIALGG